MVPNDRPRGRVGRRKLKRGFSWYYVIAPPSHQKTGQERGHIWKGGFRSRRDAIDALCRVMAKIEEEGRLAITLAEWINEWFRYWRRAVRPVCSTVRASSECCKLSEALGEHCLSELCWGHIQLYVYQSLEDEVGRDGRPVSLGVVRRRLGRLRQVLQYAVQRGMIAKNPATGVYVRRDGV